MVGKHKHNKRVQGENKEREWHKLNFFKVSRLEIFELCEALGVDSLHLNLKLLGQTGGELFSWAIIWAVCWW